MYVGRFRFECLADVALDEAQLAISALLDAYRYNGQIIGREFPLILDNDGFEVSVVCPEQDSVAPKFNSPEINQHYQAIKDLGLAAPEFNILGLEGQSDFTDSCALPDDLIMYSTFVQSCSPIRCLSHFAPVPLYKLPEAVRYELIKWQENQAGLDQLQMNGLAQAEAFSVQQLSELDSEFIKQGMRIGEKIKSETGKNVYQYLYRVGGESIKNEQTRTCPSCGSKWQCEPPLHGIFDFKCDSCLLVSNISWDLQ